MFVVYYRALVNFTDSLVYGPELEDIYSLAFNEISEAVVDTVGLGAAWPSYRVEPANDTIQLTRVGIKPGAVYSCLTVSCFASTARVRVQQDSRVPDRQRGPHQVRTQILQITRCHPAAVYRCATVSPACGADL